MSEDEKRQILREQLGYLYQLNEINIRNRFAIKNWCIAVWLGLIVAILKLFEEPSAIEKYPSLPLIVFLPVVLFWFTEAVYGGQTKLYRKQIVDFEKKINTESSQNNKTEDIFIRSHYEKNFGLKEKFFSLAHSLFGCGTLTFFYVVMFAASFIFIFFFFPNFSVDFHFAIDFHINILFLLVLFVVILIAGFFIARFLENKIKLKQ